MGVTSDRRAAVASCGLAMSRLRVSLGLLLALLIAALAWHFVPSTPPARPTPVPRQPPAVTPPAPPTPLPPPAPHPPQPLPVAEVLVLPLPDGNPLRARWYAATVADAPIIVLDAGAGADLHSWQVAIAELLAQRPAHVLWIDDAQPRHSEASVRAVRALARWNAALAWLDVRAPRGRLALIGAREAGDAAWLVADRQRPLSLAVIAPDAPPAQPLPPEVAARFALVAVPLAESATPTWLAQLHNARVYPLLGPPTAPLDAQLQSDLAGWLFVALGPR